MVLDLNDAEEQREGTSGAIPPKSIVPVQLTIRRPKQGKEGFHPMVVASDTGYQYLDCEFEVMAGQFQGRKIWENLGLMGTSDGQKKGVEIAKRKLRAIVEAIRNIQPKDASPQAAQGRRLNSIEEIQGAFFGIKVGVEKPKSGDKYVNNSIALIITPDHEFYNQVMSGNDLITDEALPDIPPASGSPAPSWAAGGAAKAPAAAPPGQGSWAAPKTQTPPAGNSSTATTPGWATQPAQLHTPAQDHLGPAFPTEASGMDSIPF